MEVSLPFWAAILKTLAICMICGIGHLHAQSPYSSPNPMNSMAPDPALVDASHAVSDRSSKVLPIPDEMERFFDQIKDGNSRAFGFHVPPKGTLLVRLEHPDESFFVLNMATRSGAQLPGMRFNKVRAVKQSVRFENNEDKDVDLIVLVQGPPRNSSDAWVFDTPYSLKITRGRLKS